ncbi:MAG: FtsL-like putative cell division protein [Bacteroidetes bacterium]|nr:FtsL-like putative cell division protein [Bacteroidota bacterium]MDA1121080.1 FtsL-like putative cell division protein [Bacteroidota bacterium]
MSGNTFKIKSASSKNSFFSWLEKSLKVDDFVEQGIPLRFLPQLLFLAGLLIFYIGNKHFAEKTIRNINRTEREVEDLRADYTTLKAEYMFASKQSEVARRVGKIGLTESKIPPFKIIPEKK